MTLSSIHTGGFDTDWNVQEIQPQIVQMAFLGMSSEQRWAAASSRDIAERTGGISSIFRYAADGLASLERAARLTYLIGYVPARAPDDTYRRVEVRVDRPNVQVLHRRTYYARAIAPSYDHRAYVTGLRVAAARAYRGSIEEVPFKAVAARGAAGNQTAVVLDITILPATLTFLEKDGKRSAHFTVRSPSATWGTGRMAATGRVPASEAPRCRQDPSGERRPACCESRQPSRYT